MIKNLLTARWFTVIAPPSLYTSRALTYFEARNLCNCIPSYFMVFDPFGRFRAKYIKNTLK